MGAENDFVDSPSPQNHEEIRSIPNNTLQTIPLTIPLTIPSHKQDLSIHSQFKHDQIIDLENEHLYENQSFSQNETLLSSSATLNGFDRNDNSKSSPLKLPQNFVEFCKSANEEAFRMEKFEALRVENFKSEIKYLKKEIYNLVEKNRLLLSENMGFKVALEDRNEDHNRGISCIFLVDESG